MRASPAKRHAFTIHACVRFLPLLFSCSPMPSPIPDALYLSLSSSPLFAALAALPSPGLPLQRGRHFFSASCRNITITTTTTTTAAAAAITTTIATPTLSLTYSPSHPANEPGSCLLFIRPANRVWQNRREFHIVVLGAGGLTPPPCTLAETDLFEAARLGPHHADPFTFLRWSRWCGEELFDWYAPPFRRIISPVLCLYPAVIHVGKRNMLRHVHFPICASSANPINPMIASKLIRPHPCQPNSSTTSGSRAMIPP